MKKAILLLLGLATAYTGMAQYNKSYSYSLPVANNLNAVSTDLITTDHSTVTMLGYTQDPSEIYAYKNANLTIKKLDFAGNTVFDKMYKLSTTGHSLYPSKIVQTLNNGYIVTGYIDFTPFAAGFDANGSWMWCYIYPTANPAAGNQNFDRPNIVRVQDDLQTEDYIISASSGADPSGQYNADNYTDALRIGANGKMKWHNRYLPAWNRSGYPVLQDNSSMLTYVPRLPGTPSASYFIGGNHMRSTIAGNFYMQYMGIDNQGHIVRPYTIHKVPQYPMHLSCLFDNDPLQPSICLAYTFGNTNIASPYSASAIGFSKISLNYNMLYSFYYYEPNSYATENYGTSIAKVADSKEGGYVIGTFSYYNFAPSPFSGAHAGILRLNNSGGYLWNKGYNISANWQEGITGCPITDVVDGATNTENYVLTSGVANSSGTSSIKILSTDNNGSTCGDYDIPLNWGRYFSVDTPYSYFEDPETGMKPLDMRVVEFDDLIAACDPGNPNYKPSDQGTAVIDFSTGKFAAYPTLLAADNLINIVCNSDRNMSISAGLYTIDGRTIERKQFHMNKGENTISWQLPVPATGTYIISLENDDKTFRKTIRVSKP